MKDSSSKVISVAGRRAYLSAIQNYWPEVLEALQTDIAPRYEKIWTDHPKINNPSNQLQRSVAIRDAMHGSEFMSQLEYWAHRFSMKDEWLKEIAIDTIFMHRELETPAGLWSWVEMRLEFLSPGGEFKPTLKDATWSPDENRSALAPGETWDSFNDRMRTQFYKQLSLYRNESKKRHGLGTASMKRHAEWAVRYQKGENAKDIAMEIQARYEDRDQAVYKAIARFAKNIGLTLEKRRRA